MMKKILIILAMLLWCEVSFTEECIGNCENGKGKLIMNSINAEYDGEWKNGKFHGKGSLIFKEGSENAGYKFEGEFRNGSKFYGTDITPKGNKYVGPFKNGRAHGQGNFTSADGTVAVGEFKKGKQHGTHTVTHKDGTIVVAEFKNGKIKKVISRDTSVRDKAKKKLELASMIGDAKKTCKELGFTEGTEKFSDCSLKLYSQSVEVAAKNNQTVVMQPQSSGSSSMTIYDPVRDSRALMRQGQRMLSGACTFGINC